MQAAVEGTSCWILKGEKAEVQQRYNNNNNNRWRDEAFAEKQGALVGWVEAE